MDRTKDFTFDPINFPIKKVKALTSKLHSRKQRYVVMIDPAISTNTSYEPYSRGHNMDVFMKLNDGKTELRKYRLPGNEKTKRECVALKSLKMVAFEKIRGTGLARLHCIS
jgi:alpha-glucosidase (family GH31 glycosyl hydrolase)